jgi:hypothetical protein
MKRIAFVGPSLPEESRRFTGSLAPGVILAPPARFGDILRATREDHGVIVLVDGLFGNVAPPRHKEILHALSRGVIVIGAASLGALRAAECARFGMIGIGQIFDAFVAGRIWSDDAVAQLHAPAELGYASLSDPLVTIDSNLRHLTHCGMLSAAEADLLKVRAAGQHFTQRSLRTLVDEFCDDPARRAALLAEIENARIDPKRDDALAAIQFAATVTPAADGAPAWTFSETSHGLRGV